ncbi:uncharacterized protein LOC143921952 [Arctopsyche grandis]|uniref:uncharacterized protein LOC143921952 n=1 Tax=Arctopsyche grandis TaxID=121162 RepID=UPI00406D8962
MNFFKSNCAKNNKIGNSLLLIAHPDDESMFFSPFLYSNKPFILCLSDGGFEGKGEIRRKELAAIKNMLFHQSQLVWFRYLYILFSSYMKYVIII